jgi:hypothetical protein
MSENSDVAPYKIEKDAQGRLSTVRRSIDDYPIPIDPDDRQYCKFLTWAANQTPAIAESFGRLEKGSIYYGQESDVITYCK